MSKPPTSTIPQNQSPTSPPPAPLSPPQSSHGLNPPESQQEKYHTPLKLSHGLLDSEEKFYLLT